MKNQIFSLTILLLFSCKRESRFNLEKDLYQFSRAMENGDTLEVNINHSACMFAAFENYNFVKQNDTIFLETHSEISSFEKQQQTLSKIPYFIDSNDTLSFENYFKYLEKENKPKRDYSSPIVTVHYPNKNQTKYFNNEGLKDKFEKLDRLFLVRKKLYPNDKFFEDSGPPPPPPASHK
jgi:hypothetical protein